MTPKFTIYAPPYSDKSAGIWILHFLCHRLNHIGIPASLVIYPSCDWVNPEFKTPISYDEDSIVVYPEIIWGNPLGAKKVVRYLLNYDGVLTGRKIEWGENDFPLTFSSIFRKDCESLFYPIVNMDIFYNDKRPREGFCLYQGKRHYKGPIPQLDYVEITRTWPESKHELAEIFRSKALLFSCDSLTSTSIDAALCGCVPVLFHPMNDIGELGKFWANDLSEIPQVMQTIAALPEKIRELQNSFDERLATTVTRIAEHFEARLRSSGTDKSKSRPFTDSCLEFLASQAGTDGTQPNVGAAV